MAQNDLERGLWIIPVESLKQRKMLTRKKRRRAIDIPPYIVPLSVQAQEIVRHMLGEFKTAQRYRPWKCPSTPSRSSRRCSRSA